MDSVIESWVFELPLRMQSVLMAAIRGADGSPKEDKSKFLVRALRNLLLNNADLTNSFMKDDLTGEQIEAFASDIDHYYVHFLMHFTHATEIVGYKHPDNLVRGRWLAIYKRICKSLHLNFETEPQLDVRLGHTPEYLEQKKEKKVTAQVAVAVEKKFVSDPEARKRSEADRPLELDLEEPVYSHVDDKTRGPCECGHPFVDHYQLKPETQPDLYECQAGKCDKHCKSYLEKKAPPPKKPATAPVPTAGMAVLKVCICQHNLATHQVPNFSGDAKRCSAGGCHCRAFVDKEEAQRTGDAGTGTSRNEGYERGSS